MSAMMTGVNTNQSVFGFGEGTEANDFNRDGDGDQPWTLLELAKARGLKVGAVTTARLTHATPAATYAHVNHRDKEEDIAAQPADGCCLQSSARVRR
jgi:alkaline phosphatase